LKLNTSGLGTHPTPKFQQQKTGFLSLAWGRSKT